MKITNYKPLDKGPMAASLDIEIEEWGITFKKCTLFQSGDKRWISFPSMKYEVDGQTKYLPYIFMEKTRKQKFDAKILSMIDAGEYEKVKEYFPTALPAQKYTDEECPF